MKLLAQHFDVKQVRQRVYVIQRHEAVYGLSPIMGIHKAVCQWCIHVFLCFTRRTPSSTCSRITLYFYVRPRHCRLTMGNTINSIIP